MSLHQFIGALIVIIVIESFLLEFIGKRNKKVDNLLNYTSPTRWLPDKIKWWFMVSFAIACIFLYLYCWICRILEHDAGDDALFFDFIFRDLMGILPWFVWGCIMAGVIMKYLSLGRLRLPKSMIGAGLFGSLIPICSCAAIPMAHGMMMGRQMRVRAVIAFLIVVPVLSPVVYILAIGETTFDMKPYLAVEIIAVFALAIVTGLFIERFAGVKNNDDPSAGCLSCEGCKTSHMTVGRTSAMLASWDQLLYLLKFILFGIVIGAAISTFIDPDTIGEFFGNQGDYLGSLPGLVLIVCIAIPIFICTGEDILILAPLLVAGLPLGHAVAFAIAGNAICITAIPVLNATFGKKVTALIFIAFFVGSVALGMIINAIVWGLGYG